MKLLLFVIVSTWLFSCVAEKEIQVEAVIVELVKVDTIQRHMNIPEQMLTWKTADEMRFVSYASLNSHYLIGSKMQVMMRK